MSTYLQSFLQMLTMGQREGGMDYRIINLVDNLLQPPKVLQGRSRWYICLIFSSLCHYLHFYLHSLSCNALHDIVPCIISWLGADMSMQIHVAEISAGIVASWISHSSNNRAKCTVAEYESCPETD